MTNLRTRQIVWLIPIISFLFLGAQDSEDSIKPLLLALVILLPAAKVAGWIVEKFGQPAVLGELLAGMALGNLGLVGFNGLDYLKNDSGLEILARLGVILLLFEVGLDSSLADLLKVGISSLLVAIIGVVLPFGFGWLVSSLWLPERSAYVHAFIGATLCATSVGITARVLKESNRLKTREAKIILGAAVIDDVLGLVVLAVITGLVIGAGTGAGASAGSVIWLVVKVSIFLVGSLLLGVFFAPRIVRQVAKAKSKGMLFTFALAFCFLLSYLSTVIGLAAIVGAFAAGLILEGVPFQEFLQEGEHSPEEMLHPISTFLVPLFFLYMGIKIELATLFRFEVIGLALALTFAAIIGKQACALAALERGLNRLAIGLGMVPRGEVGLIFAGVGLKLKIGEQPILNDRVFAAILVMVIITTLLTPPLLQWSFSRHGASNRDVNKPR
jgi:Kef-type K+ transport system membrane component KefB